MKREQVEYYRTAIYDDHEGWCFEGDKDSLERLDVLFDEFWGQNPSKEEFCWVMSGITITAGMMWVVGRR